MCAWQAAAWALLQLLITSKHFHFETCATHGNGMLRSLLMAGRCRSGRESEGAPVGALIPLPHCLSLLAEMLGFLALEFLLHLLRPLALLLQRRLLRLQGFTQHRYCL